MLAQKTADNFLKTLDRLEYGRFELVTPEGRTHIFGGRNPGPSSTLILNEWKVLTNLLARGDSGFAEDYKRGLWDTTNLQDLLSLALVNDNVLKPYLFGNKMAQIMARVSYLFRSNSVEGSKRNIHAHYDLGNDFYKLWLDDTMTYSAAIYKRPDEDLVSAQHNKYDRILERTGRENGKMLEIGCGWGGFADRAMNRGDYDLKSVTISKAQHAFAQDRLNGKADIALQDYRALGGKFDSIVSIEMFEAVGEKYWPVYFKKVGDLLTEKGRAVIQTITIKESLFPQYRKGGDVIRDYIFPGGMLPSPERFVSSAQQHGLRAENRFDFGQDYARTLEVWLHNFEHKVEAIKSLGFDDAFIRIWRFYLAACIAGFRTGRTDVMQIELSHA